MPRAKSKPTDMDAAWADVLADSIALPERPEGEGWRTAREITDDPAANPKSKTVGSIQKVMETLVSNGRLEKAVGITNGRKTNYYRPCQTP